MAWTAPRTWTDGELVTKAIMDPHVRDNFLAVGPHLIIRKPSDESVTSSIALQNDDHLLLAVGTSEVWLTQWNLLVTSTSGTPDIRVAFTFPTGGSAALTLGTVLNGGGTLTYTAWNSTTSPTSTESIALSASVLNHFMITGVFVNGGTGGNLQLQWAQQTSDAAATTMKANSTLFAVKLA